jgi:hypothetical protein
VENRIEISLYSSSNEIRAYATIDASDAEIVCPYRWRVVDDRRRYAVRQWGHARVIFMHRELTGLPRDYDGREVDHVDRNVLHNWRSNLRILSHAENCQNLSSRPGSTSRYRGVHWHQGKQRWEAQVKIHGKTYHIGRFHDEEEAYEAVVAARLRLMPYTMEIR